MPCYSPLEGWRSKFRSETGKRPITFNFKDALLDQPMTVPCGQCIGCRLERSRQWAIRCMHEAQMWENNCFLTLTFSPEYLETRDNMWSLDKTDFQKFMKRFRKRFKGMEEYINEDGETTYPIRYYHCGEYGDLYHRPHYHACIFNYDFPDKELFRVTNTGHRLYRSDALDSLWPYGFATIGNVTFESAAYVARYIMKKQTGDAKEEAYTTYDKETGEILFEREPEYNSMSLKPAIGATWYEKYGKQVRDNDFVIVNEKRVRPPKYYDSKFELLSPEEYKQVKKKRVDNAKKHEHNNTDERLLVRKKCAEIALSRLPRTHELGENTC